MFGDLTSFITSVGYLGVAAMVFAESGLFFGFFLPGDSLIVTVGYLASIGVFNIYYLLLILPLAAIAGDTVGYWFGHKFGRRRFSENSRFLKLEHLRRTEDFYARHGGKTIIFARFVPIVRTFAPIVAGVAKMKYKTFISYNVFGGLFWTISMLLIGNYLGEVVGDSIEGFVLVIGVIVLLSILPGFIGKMRK
jgi:membrane-associated protein